MTRTLPAWLLGLEDAQSNKQNKRAAFFEPNNRFEEGRCFLLLQERFPGGPDACENFHDGQTHEDT